MLVFIIPIAICLFIAFFWRQIIGILLFVTVWIALMSLFALGVKGFFWISGQGEQFENVSMTPYNGGHRVDYVVINNNKKHAIDRVRMTCGGFLDTVAESNTNFSLILPKSRENGTVFLSGTRFKSDVLDLEKCKLVAHVYRIKQ